ncbi:MAG: sce7726 family protein [Streptosporangiaceae bacterium]
MRAGEILAAVESKLQHQHRQQATVYKREWSIGVGATRIDIAAINGTITGCEIKSARDNFGRLAAQVRLYSAVLDTAILVVEGESAAARAAGIVPAWWGIWCARPQPAGGPSLDAVRDGEPNPAPDPLSIAQLLWRDEAYGVLEHRGLAAGLRAATRWRLWEALADRLPLPDLRHEVREAIKARPEW